MADDLDFETAFHALTDNDPFPWQREMYRRIVEGAPPKSCQIPTGLGKTSVMAIWLIALARNPNAVPRRLVYVVNRRTVVDQSTREAEKLRANLDRLSDLPPGFGPLAISTLRGQFADNREWSADPSRPAIIVGTVDMIGSRLLFSGYGIGFKLKPLHAGFLGQDVLLIHDEAHLEPAFQELLIAIQREQERCHEFQRFRVMELSATSREQGEIFRLTEEERNPPGLIPDPPTSPTEVAWRRLTAKKGIAFSSPEDDREKVADRIGKLAKQYSESHPGSAVLVFVNSLEGLDTVRKHLKGESVQLLTGTLRGLERDQMADPRKETGCPIFARFLKPPAYNADDRDRWRITPTPGTVYLLCTSAGEVGIDISADHMACDLTFFDRMAQRLGRVNRFGNVDARIEIVHEAEPDSEDDPNEKARRSTLELLQELPKRGERRLASPLELMRLGDREDLAAKIRSAYSPGPVVLPVSDILFDAWALTSIRGELPGRPTAEPYLHGVAERQPPDTYVAWREEVDVIRTKRLRDEHPPEDLLAEFPLKPHELLRDRSDRVFKRLESLARRHPDEPVWLLDDYGSVMVLPLAELADKEKKDRIGGRTLLLSPKLGGLKGGLLTDDPDDSAADIADLWPDAEHRRRERLWSNESRPPVPSDQDMRLIRTIDTRPEEDGSAEVEADVGERTPGQYWSWFERRQSADDDMSKTSSKPVAWDVHTKDVTERARRIVERLSLPEDVREAVIRAAEFHDLGKKRVVWQRSIGNPKPTRWLAKSGGRMKPIDLNGYRHEFGSLVDVQIAPEFQGLSEDLKELVLHFIAAHHGLGRPHFPPDQAFDPHPQEADVDAIAAEVPLRFARLQRKYGRWGLAYLESLLRAADYAASISPSAFLQDEEADAR